MQTCHKISEITELVSQWKAQGLKIAVVPTMGYLHEGHLSLMRIARAEADRVIVSIFVNPTQFGPSEDLDKYPRDLARDTELCAGEGVDAIFNPEPQEMYDGDFSCWVNEESLSQTLCGAFRPIHFRGVCTVCLKLFNITRADVAVFGRKDAQQLLIIQRMVRDLNVPIRIIPAPLIREEDGLAMSSRNKYLSPEERSRALAISRSLKAAESAIAGGEKSLEKVIGMVRDGLSGADRIDYVEIMDRRTLRPAETLEGPLLLAVAAFFGSTRLIDNIFIN